MRDRTEPGWDGLVVSAGALRSVNDFQEACQAFASTAFSPFKLNPCCAWPHSSAFFRRIDRCLQPDTVPQAVQPPYSRHLCGMSFVRRAWNATGIRASCTPSARTAMRTLPLDRSPASSRPSRIATRIPARLPACVPDPMRIAHGRLRTRHRPDLAGHRSLARISQCARLRACAPARGHAGTRARGEVRESVNGHGHEQPPSAMTMPAFARGHSHQPSSSRRKVGEAWRQRTSPRTARARTASSAQRAQPALEACTAQDPTRRSMQSARVDAAHACERGAHFPPFGAFRGLAWILNDVSRALSLQRPIHFLVHPPPKSQSDWSKPP